jgi:hypothetical protein
MTLLFEDAQEAMAKYVCSNEFISREDSEYASTEILAKINRMGLITIGSQEGIVSQGYNDETNLFWKNNERGCLSGFMKSTRAEKFIEWININTNKIAFKKIIISTDAFYSKFYKDNELTGIIVTTDGSSKKSYDNVICNWFSRINMLIPKHWFDDEKQKAQISADQDVIMVELIDPEYGRLCKNPGGLYGDVIKGLEKIQ